MKAREKAFEIIKRVHLENAHASLIMRYSLKDYSDKDQALIMTIVYGTLKNYRYLRYQWQEFVKDNILEEVSLLIDMSVFQILYLDKIPNHAVVNEAIEISKKVEYGKYRKLVTAVLHRFIKEKEKLVENHQILENVINLKEEDITSSLIENLALRTSHPLWLVELWIKELGFLKTVNLCFFNNQTAELQLRVNTLKISFNQILKDEDFKKHPLAKNAVLYKKNILKSKYFRNREVVIQSASSQVLSELITLKKDLKVLDMCSAPGGKAFHLASLMNNQGSILAVDIHKHRTELIEKEMVKQNIKNIKVFTKDATTLTEKEVGKFDVIIIDAPCTGFGVLRNKPEIKITTTKDDMDALVKLQKELLDTAASLLLVSGQLIYGTCTINELENQLQVQDFLKRHSNFKLELEQVLLPYLVDSDGFYIAKLKRIN